MATEEEQDDLDHTGEEPEPEDVDPGWEDKSDAEPPLDSSDDEGADDGLELITLAAALPSGYQAAPAPEAEQLEYKHARGEELVNQLLLFNWTAVGWTVGTVVGINKDGRKKVKVGNQSLPANFIVSYEQDESEASHCLRLDEYGASDSSNLAAGCCLLKLESEPEVD